MSQITRQTATAARSGSLVNPLLTNLFPIKTENLSCTYNLWEVTGLSDNESLEQNKVALRFKVSRSIKGPAQLITENNRLLLAIPQGYQSPPETHISLAPDVAVLRSLVGRLTRV